MLTEEVIQSISPSPKNFTDGKALQKDLFETGKKEHLYWGKCQGSGANPYMVMFNAHSLSYKCSCPVGNRGIVCKHTLGLMIKSIHQADVFVESEPPTWAENWVKKQLEKKEKTESIITANQADEKVITGLERIRDAKSKTAKNREKQMSEGIELLNSYLSDILNEGTLIAATWSNERKEVLIQSLNSAKMPALAYMIEENLDNNPAETITKAAILSNLWQKRDSLSVEVQEFLLGALGSYIKKEEVVQLKDIVKDVWLCVGYYNEYRYKPSRMTLHHWFLIGKNTGQWTRIMHTEVYAAYGNTDPKPNLQIGRIYDGSIAYFPASQRGILLNDWQISTEQDNFVLQKDIVPHYQDKIITELPLFFGIKSAKNVFIQKTEKQTYLVQINNQVYECFQDLQNLWIAQTQDGITLIYAQIYPHSIIVLGGILGNSTFVNTQTDIENAMAKQYLIPEVLKKRLEIGKKMGDIQLEGLDNKGLQPIQQWARTFLWYNYGADKTFSFEKPAFITENISNPVTQTFFETWLKGIKQDNVFIQKGLDLLKEKKYTLTPYMLSSIAHQLDNITNIQAYKDVLGSRAKYLFDFDETKHTEEYYITLFEEGKTEERKKAYTFLLNHNPKVLKELIKKVYKKEKVDLRKYWIHNEEVDLFDGTDEVWILEQLKNEKNYDVKTEWIWKLGSVILDDAEKKPFAIAQQWINALDKYIQFETVKKGLKAKITLPEKQDFEYFEEMSTWKGIHGEKAGVLMFLLSCKPVHTWQYSIDELAKALKGNEYGQVFWDGLALSCYRYQQTPQKWIDEIYKGKYSNYWQHLLTSLVSTELCIEIAFKTTTIFTNFAQSLLERKNITHEHLLYILELLAQQSYKNHSLGNYAQYYVSLFVRNAKQEHIQEYIDKLSKCTNNTEIVTPFMNVLKNLQGMYTALS